VHSIDLGWRGKLGKRRRTMEVQDGERQRRKNNGGEERVMAKEGEKGTAGKWSLEFMARRNIIQELEKGDDGQDHDLQVSPLRLTRGVQFAYRPTCRLHLGPARQ
jgi:hypothetical protein